jgi:hypothetical protein
MTDAFEIHRSRRPILRIDSGPDVTMKTAVRPIPGCTYIAVLDRVVMDVLDVPGKIGLVAQDVLPEPMLPNGLLAFFSLGVVRRCPQIGPAVLAEPSLDEAPARREIRVVRR